MNRRRKYRRLQGALLGSFLTTVIGLAALALFAPERLEIPETFDGITSEGVPINSPTVTEPEFKPLQTKLGGKWGNPGHNPFRGDTYSALRLMGLPPAQAVVLAQRMAIHASEGEIIFSNAGVRDREGIYKFSPYYAMTFGNTLSFATKTNFKDNDIQRAERYTVMEDGKPAVFAVPYVCGNVTRLTVLPQEEVKSSGNRPGERLVSNDKDSYEQGYIEGYRFAVAQIAGKQEFASTATAAATVPEPGTWALMLIGLASLALKRRKFKD